MRFLVCVKQVPDVQEVSIDPDTKTLNRKGVPSILNPFDSFALEMAVRLKEKHGGEIIVITMGPPQAANMLKDCIAVGADKAILVTDPAFGGSDTLATSYILAQTIKTVGDYDIIFCGKQAIDGDTAQVGPGIAEHLNIAQVTYARQILLSGDIVRIQRELETGIEIIEASLPLLVTVTKNAQIPRIPSLSDKLASKKATVQTLHKHELLVDITKIGLTGSPTKVKSIFVPARKKSNQIILSITAVDAAGQLVSWLEKQNFFVRKRSERNV